MMRIALLFMLLACGPVFAAEGTASHKDLAKVLLGVVSLDVYAESPSKLHLLIGERMAAGRPPQLSYFHSDDGGETWTDSVIVGGELTPDPIKRGNDAQIVASGDRLYAVWTTGAATKMGRGPLAASHSGDGGKTWTPAKSPSDASGVIDHAFNDLAADDSGNFHAVWLDARPSAATLTSPDMPTKGLRYARSADGGVTWAKNQTLDAQCCECCWNYLLVQPGGRVNVLYRDKDPRDMALLRSNDAGHTWDAPVTVGAFDWNFTGCPHVGGALAAGGADKQNLSAVVWTAKGGSAFGVFALSSKDAGKTWGSPTQLGGPQASRPDIAAAGDRVIAVWDEFLEGADAAGNAAFAATSTDAGKTWSSPQMVSDPKVSISHPRIVTVGNGFRVFWTEQSSGKPVRWASRVVR
jgi:Neuraminidase (sialidase)